MNINQLARSANRSGSKRTRSYWIWVVLAVLALPIFLLASIDRGNIRGTVTDEQGAVVPAANIVVKNIATNVVVDLTSNSEGFYFAPELVPGKYSIHVEVGGFSPLDITHVTVSAGTTVTVDVRVKLGAVSEHIEVTAEVSLVESSPANFSTSLGRNYIDEVPLVGRDIQSLVQLIPGITQSFGPPGAIMGFDSAFSGFADPLHAVGSGVSANGGQAGANAWYLDGSSNAAQGMENVVVNPSPDAVEEFNVVNNGLAAEWSGTSGAVVNVVLKSGSNNFHGNLYEFNRNSYFTATNPFARRDEAGQPLLKPRININNFGATLGGPILRNRTFFFGSYDINVLHATRPTILTVPLPGHRVGDFRGDPRYDDVCDPINHPNRCIYDPYTTIGPDENGLFHRAPFPTPVIPPDRVDPLAKYYMDSFPNPNFLDPLQQGPDGCKNTCSNFIGPAGSSLATHNISLKIDHVFSEKHKLFGEWLYNPSFYDNFRYPWNGPTAQIGTGWAGAQPYDVRNQIFAVGLTSTFSATFLNEARGMFSRQSIVTKPNSDEVAATTETRQRYEGLNLPPLDPRFAPVPQIDTNVGTFGTAPWQNAIQGAQALTFIDNVTKILGNHTLKGGLMFRRNMTWFNAAYDVDLNFDTGLTSDPVTGSGGNGLAQFLLGAVGAGSSGVFHAPWQSNDQWGLYFQDDIRVTPNLSVHIGLRYDIYGWYRERHDAVGVFNFTGQNPKVPFPGRIDYVATSRHPDRNTFPANKNGIGPRFSFAWSPFGNQKMVIRGGYGIINSNAIGLAFTRDFASGSTPGYSAAIGWLGDLTGQRPIFRLSDGAPTLALPDLSLNKKNDEQFLAQYPTVPVKVDRDPYTQQWSLSVQRELPSSMALSLSYVGTHGSHLYGDLFRDGNHIPTSTRLKIRNNIYNNVPVDPSVAGVVDNLYGPGTCDLAASLCPGYLALKPYPHYGSITVVYSPDGYSLYNSFQARLEKRYSQGLNFILAYTFQKNITSPNTGALVGAQENPVTFGRGNGRAGQVAGGIGAFAAAEDPDDRRRYRALAADDIPQILNLAAIYELPFGKGKRFASHDGVAQKLLGGWKLTQNWNFQSGVPLQITGPCNAVSCFPNVIGDPSRGRDGKNKVQRQEQWLDPSAFEPSFGSDPAVVQAISTGFYPNGTEFDYNSDIYWQFGNAGYRLASARAPGFWNADFALAKNLHLAEKRYLQFRWEVYNALNHQNLAIPNTGWCLPPKSNGDTDAIHQFGCQFGKITNIQTDPRSMQFGIKFYW